MMANVILSQFEKFLLGTVAFVLITSISLALCICLVLPHHWTKEGYVKENQYNRDELIVICKCGKLKYTTHSFDCVPRSFSPRDNYEPRQLPAKTVCELIQNYPYVVSLSAPAYGDDTGVRRFACAGTILSTNWVLIGSGCVRQNSELRHLIIRAGSTYWSKGGTEYHVHAVAKLSEKGPVALKVKNPFKFDEAVSAVKVPNKVNYVNWGSAVSIGWNEGNRRKYDKLIVRRWTTVPCMQGTCSTGEVQQKRKSICDRVEFGDSLVTDARLLVGIQTETCYDEYNMTKYIFADVQTSQYNDWLNFLIDGSERHAETVQTIEGENNETIQIYEMKDCALKDPNFWTSTSINNVVSESAFTEKEELLQSNDAGYSTTESTSTENVLNEGTTSTESTLTETNTKTAEEVTVGTQQEEFNFNTNTETSELITIAESLPGADLTTDETLLPTTITTITTSITISETLPTDDLTTIEETLSTTTTTTTNTVTVVGDTATTTGTVSTTETAKNTLSGSKPNTSKSTNTKDMVTDTPSTKKLRAERLPYKNMNFDAYKVAVITPTMINSIYIDDNNDDDEETGENEYAKTDADVSFQKNVPTPLQSTSTEQYFLSIIK